jgi:hypothetical protein
MTQNGWKCPTTPRSWDWTDLRAIKSVCMDCGAQMERHVGFDRCPWSNRRRGVTVMDAGRVTRFCRWPYGQRPQTDVLPTAKPSR